MQKKTIFMINGNGSVEWGNFRPFPWLLDFNPPCIFHLWVTNSFPLSRTEHLLSSNCGWWKTRWQVWGAPRSHFPTLSWLPSPLLSGRGSPPEREVRPHTHLSHLQFPVLSALALTRLPTHLFHPWAASQPQVHVLYFLIWYYGHSPEVCWTHNTTTWWVANSSQGPSACISAPTVMTCR